ncbi:MAG TPA: hypothetical protein VJN68_14055 [Burkholderiaceae bacterium]|nr:hypothetical protein [Burkholderiaceae bacterium]
MNGLSLRAQWVAGTIGFVLLAGCGNWMTPESQDGQEELAVVRGAIAVSPPPSTFAVLARHGVTFADRAAVSGGNVGVLASGTATPSSISGGSGVHISVGHEVMAERVSVGGSSVLGNIDANQIVTNGSITGTQSPFVSPPAPPVPGAATP